VGFNDNDSDVNAQMKPMEGLVFQNSIISKSLTDAKKYSALGDTIEEVIRRLSLTSPVSYRITPRKLMEDGTYKQEETTINLK